MSTITSGNKGRTDIAGASNRTAATVYDDAKFGKIKSISGSLHVPAFVHLTGSDAGSGGFIIQAASTTVLHPTEGAPIPAGNINAKELYEISLSRITGSGTISVVY